MFCENNGQSRCFPTQRGRAAADGYSAKRLLAWYPANGMLVSIDRPNFGRKSAVIHDRMTDRLTVCVTNSRTKSTVHFFCENLIVSWLRYCLLICKGMVRGPLQRSISVHPVLWHFSPLYTFTLSFPCLSHSFFFGFILWALFVFLLCFVNILLISHIYVYFTWIYVLFIYLPYWFIDLFIVSSATVSDGIPLKVRIIGAQ